jgi:hypothetical protein
MKTTSRLRWASAPACWGSRSVEDGQHKLDLWLRDRLGAFADFVPSVRRWRPDWHAAWKPCAWWVLRRLPAFIRNEPNRTDGFHAALDRPRIRELENEQFDGYIFKSKSPTAGWNA